MMLPTDDLLESNVFIRDGYYFGMTVTIPVDFFIGRVTKGRTSDKGLGIGKTNFIGGNKVFPSGTIPQLSIFRRSGTVHVPLRIQDDTEILSRRDDGNVGNVTRTTQHTILKIRDNFGATVIDTTLSGLIPSTGHQLTTAGQ